MRNAFNGYHLKTPEMSDTRLVLPAWLGLKRRRRSMVQPEGSVEMIRTQCLHRGSRTLQHPLHTAATTQLTDIMCLYVRHRTDGLNPRISHRTHLNAHPILPSQRVTMLPHRPILLRPLPMGPNTTILPVSTVIPIITTVTVATEVMKATTVTTTAVAVLELTFWTDRVGTIKPPAELSIR